MKKKTFRFWAVLMLGVVCSFLFTTNASAQVVVESDTIDCGQTLYADSVSAVFKLQNNYRTPVRISKVDASCGCTTVDYPIIQIKSKKPFEITLRYDAMQLGHYAKWVDVFIEDEAEPIRLTMIGVIKSPRQSFQGRKRFAKNYDKL